MVRDRLLRATSALLLALSVGLPAAGAGIAPRPAHECTDHACFCRRPAAGTAAAPCHGQADRHGARMAPACTHDTAPGQATAVPPGVLPPSPPLARDEGWRALSPVPSRAPAAGFRTVESPPPPPTPFPRA